MKKIFGILALSSIILSSCNKIDNGREQKDVNGFLSLSEIVTDETETIISKAASAAPGNYSIFVYNSEGTVVCSTSFSKVKEDGNKISLPAGDYTLSARSTEDAVPEAAFEQPVYGASKSFSIKAGETTSLGSLTCFLLQTKVTVDYSDEFLAMVTGNGKTTVEVTAGSPLEYQLSYENGTASYDHQAGYFAVNNGSNTTMTVTFSGNIEGKSAKMVKAFDGIAPKQWRQIKFVKKVNDEGQATFDIVINDYVNDQELNNVVSGNEKVIGDDPKAPKGDGGINLAFDYENGCDTDFDNLENIVLPIIGPNDNPTICLKLRITAPNGIKKFTVDITSDNVAFTTAVSLADAEHLDLLNPTEDNMVIFKVVPFPYGPDILGATDLTFDLSTAQPAMMIGPYYGTHNFVMSITDMKGCKKSIPVTMIVNE